MSVHNLIQLREIAHDDDLPLDNLRAKPRSTPQASQGHGLETEMSLDDVKDLLGSLYVPSYIPNGFSLVHSVAWHNKAARLLYQEPSREAGASILIGQFSTAGNPMVKKGHYESIFVKEYPGYLVDGGWVGRDDRFGNLTMTWETGRSHELMFERNDTWSLLRFQRSRSTALDGRIELIKIAESMAMV